jgi:histidyl-tRNA synthetase
MTIQKPSVPTGTRDYSPEVMVRRNFIFRTIENVFRLYGYQPIETPAMEYLSTLMGKYGEEGDRLLFRILNSGNFLAAAENLDIRTEDPAKVAAVFCEKGLRYDLTVPFARYVVQHRNEITFPFRRYQIQPVWRADKPQKGRYREFYQCDVDIVGSDSLLNERELIEIIIETFSRLKVGCLIKINNRKILGGIAEYMGEQERMNDITACMDKLERTGREQVISELISRGISKEAVGRLDPLLDLRGSDLSKAEYLEELLKDSNTGLQGITEIKQLLGLVDGLGYDGQIEFDLRLARGLDYYTGTIIEVLAKDENIGSICGGGRYDDLTGIFGIQGLSGVGISFGADRIYDVMNRLDLFPPGAVSSTDLLFVNFGGQQQKYVFELAASLRKEGIITELYPDQSKIKKQMDYANRKSIPYVALVGEEEITGGKVTLKNMTSGEQKRLSIKQVISEVKNLDKIHNDL